MFNDATQHNTTSTTPITGSPGTPRWWRSLRATSSRVWVCTTWCPCATSATSTSTPSSLMGSLHRRGNWYGNLSYIRIHYYALTYYFITSVSINHETLRLSYCRITAQPWRHDSKRLEQQDHKVLWRPLPGCAEDLQHPAAARDRPAPPQCHGGVTHLPEERRERKQITRCCCCYL